MINILETIYSWVFLLGGVAGAILMRVAQWGECRWWDRHYPLPDGRKRHVVGISRAWLGGLLAFGTLGYVILQVSQTEQRYQSLAAHVERCNSELIRAAGEQDRVREENDRLSVEQRGVLTELENASAVWVHRLINPPEHIAAMELDDPRRLGYGLTVTKIYYERTDELRTRNAEIREELTRLAEERNSHPLVPPSCKPE